MVVCPDVMAFAGNGDDTALRDLQGKMIAHCENMGDRMAILDTPPDLNPQDAFDWRMNAAGLRLEVRDALLPVARGHGPDLEAAADGAAVGPRGRRLVPHATARAASTRRPRTRSRSASTGSRSRSRPRSRARSTSAASTASARSPAAASASGAPARCRATPSGATSTCGGSSTTSPSRSWRARSGPSSSRTTSGSGARCASPPRTSSTAPGAQGALFGVDAVRGVLRQVRRRDEPAGRDRGGPGRDRGRDLPGEAGRVRDLPHQPVRRRRQ